MSQAPSTEKKRLRSWYVDFIEVTFYVVKLNVVSSRLPKKMPYIKVLLVTLRVPVALRSICFKSLFEVSRPFTESIGIAMFSNTYESTNGYIRQYMSFFVTSLFHKPYGALSHGTSTSSDT